MNRIITLLIISFSIGCQPRGHEKSLDNPYAHIKDEQVAEILRAAIDRAGGIDAWRDISALDYTKHSVLYLEDGTIESEVIQRHEYKMQPEFSASITWELDSTVHRIIYDSLGSRKYEGETLVSEDGSVSESVMSALYVLGMPFKLLDSGVDLDYAGIKDIEGNRMYTIRADYAPEDHPNHSTSDIWWYYFDEMDTSFVGCMVYHPPTYALIENVAFHEGLPVKLHKERMSYRVDSVGNKMFLRAAFWYSDYDVK
jgi:hypothetical protein